MRECACACGHACALLSTDVRFSPQMCTCLFRDPSPRATRKFTLCRLLYPSSKGLGADAAQESRGSMAQPSKNRGVGGRSSLRFRPKIPGFGERSPHVVLQWKTHHRHRIHEQPLNVLSALDAFGAGWADDLPVGMYWRSLGRSWELFRPLGRRFC